MRQAIGPIQLILQLSTRVLVATLAPLFAGVWLDNHYNTAPWISLVGMGAGIIAAVTSIYRTVSQHYED
jgi:F0F1-type ATP synthase assembly protein I